MGSKGSRLLGQYATDRQVMLVTGDCLDVMAALPGGCVDLIMTSPPYADARKHTYGGVKPDEYVEWFLPRAREMHRVLAPTGSFILNIKEGARDGERLTYVMELVLALRKEVGWRWVEEYIWHKTSVMTGKWPNRFRDGWEHLHHFTKARQFKMRQDDVLQPAKESTKNRYNHLGPGDLHRHESATGSGFGRNMSTSVGREMVYPSNVLQGHSVVRNVGHSAAYPEWLPEFFIKLFTDPGDLVLDPFAGSGTTCRVAERLGRVTMGIEILPQQGKEET